MTTLQRHLGTGGATVIGLAAMVGAGVFYVWAPAAAAAGSGLLIGLALAGVVASLNALSTAQLAMAHPVAGGAYSYGRRQLGESWGFAAGWLFLWGKTASAGAIALIVGGYAWPGEARLVAVVVIIALGLVNAAGIRSTARLSVVIVACVLTGLIALLLAVGASGPRPVGFAVPAGILQSAGLLFFCFAGYARMATLGEEARDPRRTLPRAILTALAITLLLYAAIGLACLSVLGVDALATSRAPLADVAAAALGGDGWVVAAGLVAAVAGVGSLLGVLAGLSRTGLAMARGGDLPGALGHLTARTHAPVVAEGTVALLAIAGVVLLDPAQLVGFSACAVLCYYAIAHLAAFRQPRTERRLHRAVQLAGLGGCLLLALTLPWEAVVGTAVVAALGFALRGIRLVLRR